MKRRILGFARDDAGDWLAQLDCHHRQHIRHDPPFRSAPWVLDEVGRSEHIGATLDCPLCDRAELPADLEVVRTTGIWDLETTPAALRREHRVPAGTWGRLQVLTGDLHFVAQTDPVIDKVVQSGAAQPIPPDVAHKVEPGRSTRFFVEFLGPRGEKPQH